MPFLPAPEPLPHLRASGVEQYTIAAWIHHAGARRHGGGREGSPSPATVDTAYKAARYRALTLYMAESFFPG